MYQQDSRTKIYDALQKEIQTPQFLRKFKQFAKSHKQFRQFDTPQELVEFFNIQVQENETLRPIQGDSEENQINLLNPLTDDKLLHLLVSNYQNKPERKPWLLSLLLVISWKRMECTYYRFGYEALNRMNPYDSFAPVYESYIDAFMDIKQKTPITFSLHLKDRAEYLIKKELRECGRFKEESKKEIPSPEYIPWNEQIKEMVTEWITGKVLTEYQSNLVIYRTVYEYTFVEIGRKFKVNWRTAHKQYKRAVKELKPYLKGKYFSGN